ncbi:disease resistance protein RPV1-like [Eucalyptus grandis]|uniref:disease resistance protein RPV1-like n=1 Tax=Eucalyptus grandis TaxID=71139 RepID=UPI00192E7750|nr:disease resistance protein RPV1-like [Eucalyptus grandis]
MLLEGILLPDDYVNLSRQIISTTGGLPLALEVIGSLVYRQNKASWYDVLDNLREIPHEKVQDKLKISYNALNHEQQQIFLDIACLFVDKDKTNALYMWKDCGFRPDHSIQVLVCMSLIKITDHNKFWMHDQLRDLGRKIVHGDTRPTDPRKQSRLWDPETADNIIGTKERKKHIEAICLWETRVYTSKEFSRLPNIRFLMLVGGNFSGDFENHFSELRYMTCTWVSREFLAINFHPSNLVVLKPSYSSITEEWAGWSQFKVAKKLKVLDISHCSNMTRTPNFSDYLSLERLNLEDCKKLTEVDGSLKKLKCLIYFNAHGCENLRELPKGIGGLHKLKYLYLGRCEKLRKLPKSFARVTSLVELDLSHTAITRLPDSIGNQNRFWKEVQLNRLEQLVEFDMYNSDLEGFSGLSNLKRLKRLTLHKCQNLTAIQGLGSLDSLEQLNIIICPKIGSLDDLSNLKKLQFLKISSCEVLQAVKGLDELETLTTLFFVNCRSLKSFLNVFNSKVLDECFLNITGCPNLEAESFGGTVSMYKERKVRGKRRKRNRGV